jgi:hypothetical protein
VCFSFCFSEFSHAAKRRHRREAAPGCQFEELKLDKSLSRSPKTVFTSKYLSLVFVDGEALKKATAITDLGITKCNFDFNEYKISYYSAGQKKLILQEKSGSTKLVDIEKCQTLEEMVFESKITFEKCKIRKPKKSKS